MNTRTNYRTRRYPEDKRTSKPITTVNKWFTRFLSIPKIQRLLTVLKKFYLINPNYTKGTRVQFKVSSLVATGAFLLAVLGSSYSLVVLPLKDSLEDHEVRVRALEISDGRTGVHLEKLTDSIDRLINRIETRESI